MPAAVTSAEAVLEIADLSLRFGGVQALRCVSLNLMQNEILAVIGPNGAGKTSLLNCVCGLYKPQEGSVRLHGKTILGKSVHVIARAGLTRTFQGTHLLPGMTVLDNILIGRGHLMSYGLAEAFLYYPFAHRQEVEHRRRAEEIVDFLEMNTIRHEIVGTLGYGLRKRVDLGRALAMEPRILLVDEPMAGMNIEEKEDLARFLLDVREARDVSIVLVEHDMEVVMDLADRVAVFEFGAKIADDKPEAVQKNPEVIRAYLGEGR